MERRRRLVLWMAMLIMTVVFFIKSHGPSRKEGTVAFFHGGPRQTMIRVCGNVTNPGIYELSPGSNVETAIKMTLPGHKLGGTGSVQRNPVLLDGDILELRSVNRQDIDFTIKKMHAKEMIILGIPLDSNRLGVDDWDCLPGIGPALAFRIVQDRQINGDFRSLKDLQRVPGIGESKTSHLAEFF